MPGELFEIEGEKKKRVVRVDLYFFFLKSILLRVTVSLCLPHARSAISSTLTLADFTMVPDTRMSQFWVTMAMILNEMCARFCGGSA